MSTATQQVFSKAWNFAHVLREPPPSKADLERHQQKNPRFQGI
jgi:hypothetical protein